MLYGPDDHDAADAGRGHPDGPAARPALQYAQGMPCDRGAARRDA